MDEILLHQYALSPFSEKIRRILAAKKLRWRSVEQPTVAPKPKLTPLTGGYRRIPVLQIGAEIYCDTARIAAALDEILPEPTIYPKGNEGACEIVAHWADHWMFLAVVQVVIPKMLSSLPQEFLEDRAKMSPGFTREGFEKAAPDAASRVLAGISWLDDQLKGRQFLIGDAFSVADAAAYHVLWFLRNDEASFAPVASRPALKAWFDRVEGFGPGDSTPMDPDEALTVARHALTLTTERTDDSDPNGIRPGESVTIVADDYGVESVSGTAVVVTAREIAVRREDPSVGEVTVHFPRAGYRVQKTRLAP